MYIYQLMIDQKNGGIHSLFKGILSILAVIYGWILAMRLKFYELNIIKKKSLPKPVISVGNISLGGVGKTPLVECIAHYLKNNHINPAILMRGYMPSASRDENIPESDEAEQLKQSLSGVPVLVGTDRYKAGKKELNKKLIDVFLLDDGFQHWKLHRDLDIVAIDATNPFGNGRLIPRGILREDVRSIKRASVLVLTKADLNQSGLAELKEQIHRTNPSALSVEAVHQPLDLADLISQEKFPTSQLKNRSLCALSGIGNPRSFELTLKRMGADIKKHFIFRDHHGYTANDIEMVDRACKRLGVDLIITTQKDAGKIAPLISKGQSSIAWRALRIRLQIIKGEDAFFNRIADICHS